MIQSPAQSHPLPEQSKTQAPGAKPEDVTAGIKHPDVDAKVHPAASPNPAATASVKS